MKRVFLAPALLACLSIFTVTASALAGPPLPPAPYLPQKPETVTFFPSEALVQVTEKVRPASLPGGGRGYMAVLPGKANTTSLVLEINSTPVSTYRWLRTSTTQPADPLVKSPFPLLPETETDLERKGLLERYFAAKEKTIAAQSTLAGIESQLAFWHKQLDEGAEPKEVAPKATDLAEVALALGEHIPRLENLKASTSLELARAEAILREAATNLTYFDSARNTHVALIEPGNLSAEAVTLTYRYLLPVQCAMGYTLKASSEKNTLTIDQEIQLYQNTGLDWDNVKISVALVNRDGFIKPYPIAPWTLDYDVHKPKMASPARKQQSQNSMVPAQPMLSEEVTELQQYADTIQAPVQQEMSTFRLWDLGKRTIKSDEPNIMNLASNEYKASFYYTLRPSEQRRAFFTVNLDLPEVTELPLGRAICFVDGAYAGEQQFALHSKKATIYMGTDPQVTVTKRDMSDKSGEQGIFTKEKVRTLHWQYTVQNMRSKAVDVVVEEAAPVSREDTIIVKHTAKPTAEVVTPTDPQAHPSLKTFVWKKTLNPREQFIIDSSVSVESSKDKEINMGRY